MKTQTIAVDFDGVIHAYSKGWHDGTIYDPPVAGAAQTLRRLRQAGYHVLIYTTRASDRTIDGTFEEGQADQVAAYLNQHGIPFDEIFRGEKPIYAAIIDDRAVRFDPRPPWWLSFFGRITPWSICESTLERLGVIRPGQGEEP